VAGTGKEGHRPVPATRGPRHGLQALRDDLVVVVSISTLRLYVFREVCGFLCGCCASGPSSAISVATRWRRPPGDRDTEPASLT
jgi:hypothetical protein